MLKRLAVLTVLVASPAFAQGPTKVAPPAGGAGPTKGAPVTAPVSPPPDGAKMGPPPITADHQKLVDAFVGKWSMNAQLALGGAPTKFKAKTDCKKTALGRAVTCMETATLPGMGKYEAIHTFTYDAETRTVRQLSVTSMGEVHDHKCAWKGDTQLECAISATMMGKPASEAITFSWSDPKSIAVKSTTTVSGGPTIVFEATGKRPKAPKPPKTAAK